jgi:hypothetical protein
MKKLHLVGLALLAVFAFGALAVSSASAAELLLNGNALGATQSIEVEISGELLFEDEGAFGHPDLLCSGIFLGHTEGGTLMFITELLMLNLEALAGEDLAGAATAAGTDVECTDDNSVCLGSTLITVQHLPWHIELELMAAGANEFLAVFLEEIGHIPNYIVNCNTFLGLMYDECEGGSSARLFNNAGLLGEFNLAAETPNAECTQSLGELLGKIESIGAGVITSPSGALTVS